MGKRTGRREWLSMVARGVAASTVGVLGSARAARANDVGGRSAHQAHRRADDGEPLVRPHVRADDERDSRPARCPRGRVDQRRRRGQRAPADRRCGVSGAAPRRSTARFLERERPDLRASGTAGTGPAAAGHAGICRELCAIGRQPGQHHEMLQPGPCADHPRTGQELSRVRQLVLRGAGPDESQPRLRALRDVLRPGRQRPGVVGVGQPEAGSRHLRSPPQSRPDGQDLLLQRAERDDRHDVSLVVLLRALSRFREGLPEQPAAGLFVHRAAVRGSGRRHAGRRPSSRQLRPRGRSVHPKHLRGDPLDPTRCGARPCS